MAGQVWETPRSRGGSKQYAGGDLTREFYVLHEADFDAARALVESLADVEYDGYSRKQFDWEPLGYDLWRFTVTYGSAAAGSGGLRPDQLNFRLGTATRHVNQSLQTLFRLLPDELAPATGTNLTTRPASNVTVAPDGITVDADTHVGQSVVVTGGAGWTPGTYLIVSATGGAWTLDRSPAPVDTAGGIWHLSGKAPDNSGAIGTTLDAVQGADIVYPVLEFSLASSVASMSFAKLRQLRTLVRTTNRAAWNGFAKGELLYLGCEPTSPAGTVQDGTPRVYWNLAHHFRYEPNQTNVRVGDITVPFVGGHEYVWARYGGTVTLMIPFGGVRALVQRPAAVYVERVYESSEFSDLGIVL